MTLEEKLVDDALRSMDKSILLSHIICLWLQHDEAGNTDDTMELEDALSFFAGYTMAGLFERITFKSDLERIRCERALGRMVLNLHERKPHMFVDQPAVDMRFTGTEDGLHRAMIFTGHA